MVYAALCPGDDVAVAEAEVAKRFARGNSTRALTKIQSSTNDRRRACVIGYPMQLSGTGLRLSYALSKGGVGGFT